MTKKLYVTNLPFSLNDQSLEGIFTEVGSVMSAKVIVDRGTGRSKGFGFVEMSTEEEATVAIQKLNGNQIAGRPITVVHARPQQPQAPRRKVGGYARGSAA